MAIMLGEVRGAFIPLWGKEWIPGFEQQVQKIDSSRGWHQFEAFGVCKYEVWRQEEEGGVKKIGGGGVAVN